MLLPGCDRDNKNDEDSRSSSNISYHIPADGKLKEKQVIDYIEIRKNIINELSVKRSGGKTAVANSEDSKAVNPGYRYFDEIERISANALKMSYHEYLWIKDTVINTQTYMLLKQYYDLNSRIMVLLDNTLTRYREVDIQNLEGQEQKIMDDYVNEMKREIINLRDKIPAPDGGTDSLEHNVRIISKYKTELESLDRKSLLPPSQ